MTLTPTSGTPVQRKPTKSIDPLGTLRRHWLKVVVFGGGLFVLFIPFCLSLQEPYYLALGKLRVSPATATFIIRYEETPITPYYKDYVRTQVDLIQAPDILENAIFRLPAPLKVLFIPEGMSLSLAAKILGERLKVMHITGTHLILINLNGRNPEGLAEIINNIMDVYLEKVQIEEEGKDHRRLIYLKKEKRRIDEEIDNYETSYEGIV
jgi:uncharacterized protein involved in exopolysaccharide biosynthesis